MIIFADQTFTQSTLGPNTDDSSSEGRPCRAMKRKDFPILTTFLCWNICLLIALDVYLLSGISYACSPRTPCHVASMNHPQEHLEVSSRRCTVNTWTGGQGTDFQASSMVASTKTQAPIKSGSFGDVARPMVSFAAYTVPPRAS